MNGWLITMLIFSLLFMSIVIGIMIFTITRNVGIYRKNLNAPKITIEAKIVAMRNEVITSYGKAHGVNRYYATFEQKSGERLELSMERADFSLLCEGDEGTLVFQGTRLVSFTRRAKEEKGE